ncbi:MAG: hypothetical protein M5U10_12730 [Candidatus Methanoperedens sp.]|nr:hypothetical protein [Candidatus Methanoperedens nitroreducens]MDJ1422769.1 hypothetical protein [Candidatus Methanoperedens sp.]
MLSLAVLTLTLRLCCCQPFLKVCDLKLKGGYLFDHRNPLLKGIKD